MSITDGISRLRLKAQPRRPLRLRDSAAEGEANRVAMEATIQPSAYFRWKCLLELPIAALLLVLSVPLVGLLVILVRLTSPGPGVFRQTRVGKNGRLFCMYKIRTMRIDAETQTGAVWAKAGDPRMTRLGRLLRKFHLDEFPQLVNVLKGEMSLIGPRPERPEFVEVLASEIDCYRDRLAVLPGITGLAQLNLPPDTDLDSVRLKLALDLEYVQHAGPSMDVRLLLCTAARIFKLPILRLLRIERKPELPARRNSSYHAHGFTRPQELSASSFAGVNRNGEKHESLGADDEIGASILLAPKPR